MIIRALTVGMLHTNCYLVMEEETRAALVIDPGASAQNILDEAARMSARVQAIALTHGHFDHVMAAPALQEATGAKLYIHRDEVDMLSPQAVGHRGYIKEEYVNPRVDGYLEDGMKLAVGPMTFTVLHTPGHSRGSCVLLTRDKEGRGVMFSGDTLFRETCGRWDLEGGDEGQLLESLRRLHGLEDYTVYPGHMDPTTMDHERANNSHIKRALLL